MGEECAKCGAGLKPQAKFCGSCGQPVVTPAARQLDLPTVGEDAPDPIRIVPVVPGSPKPDEQSIGTQRIAPRVTPATTPPAPPPGGDRNSLILLIAAGTVLLAALATVIVVLATRSHHSSSPPAVATTVPTSASPLTSTSAPVSKTTAPGPPTTNAAPGVELPEVLSHIDSELSSSSDARQQLASVEEHFQACTLSGSDAAAAVQDVIASRSQEVDELNSLASTSNPTALQLVTLLRHAVTLSLESDRDYQTWMTDNAATGACPPADTPAKSAADALQTDIGNAKQAFINAYDPVAAQQHLKATWVPGDV
jgi:hypothetical protein